MGKRSSYLCESRIEILIVRVLAILLHELFDTILSKMFPFLNLFPGNPFDMEVTRVL